MYNNEIVKDNVTHSIDMLRLHFDLKSDKKSLDFIEYLKKQFVLLGADYWVSFRLFNYKYLYVYNGVKIGLFFNGAKNADNFKGFIEFNPNKQLKEYEFLAEKLKKIVLNVMLKSYDLAIDFRIHRSNIFFLKDRRNYRYFEKFNESVDAFSVTEYLGKRGSNGYAKLYNKTAESGLDYDLSRLELTLTELTFANLKKRMPKVMFFKDNLINNFTTTLQALIRMCYQYQDYTALSFLSKYQKQELKQLATLSYDVDIEVYQKLAIYIKDLIKKLEI